MNLVVQYRVEISLADGSSIEDELRYLIEVLATTG